MTDEPPRKKRPRPPTPEEMVVERAQTRRNGFIALGVLSVLMPALFFVNLMRDRHRHAEEMGLVPARSLPTESRHATGVLDNDDELIVVPAVVKPSRHDVAFSIGSVLGDARACLGANTHGVQVTWQVNPDGAATAVTQSTIATDAGVRADPTEAAFACVAAAVKQARVAPFEGTPVRVTYTFRSAGPR